MEQSTQSPDFIGVSAELRRMIYQELLADLVKVVMPDGSTAPNIRIAATTTGPGLSQEPYWERPPMSKRRFANAQNSRIGKLVRGQYQRTLDDVSSEQALWALSQTSRALRDEVFALLCAHLNVWALDGDLACWFARQHSMIAPFVKSLAINFKNHKDAAPWKETGPKREQLVKQIVTLFPGLKQLEIHGIDQYPTLYYARFYLPDLRAIRYVVNNASLSVVKRKGFVKGNRAGVFVLTTSDLSAVDLWGESWDTVDIEKELDGSAAKERKLEPDEVPPDL